MKILKWIGWSSAVLGAILILVGVLSQVFKFNPFGIDHNVSYLHAANSLLLLAIALFIATKKCCENCCDKDKK
ncbi:MAG: hypothetical protein ACOYMD_04370 [Paludibacter sp.]